MNRCLHSIQHLSLLGVSNVKINNVICILNPLKLTAGIEVEYDVELYLVSNVPQR